MKADTPEVVLRDIKLIKPYARNHKKHSEEQIARIAHSIEEFGFTQPILINPKGTIIAGEGRFFASKKLGLEQVPVIVKDLPEDKERIYRIADNELNVFGVVSDFKIKVEELRDLQVDARMLELANLKPQDFVFSAPNVQDLLPASEPTSQASKLFADAESEFLSDSNDTGTTEPEDETDEEYLKNFQHKEDLLEKENIDLVNRKQNRSFHFYVEIKGEYNKEELKKQVGDLLGGLGAIVR